MPLPQPYLSRHLNRYERKVDYALWCGTYVPKQLIRFMPYIPDILSQYMSDKKKFASNLDINVRKSLVYRPHSATEGGFSDEADIFIEYPEVKISYDGLLPELLKKLKLFVCDHQSTSFMQALVINTPTILFWGDSLISERENASPLFELLRKAGILFHDPVMAANQVNTIWEDVPGWWLHPDRQNARLKFIDVFCKADANWQEKWGDAFKEIIETTKEISK